MSGFYEEKELLNGNLAIGVGVEELKKSVDVLGRQLLNRYFFVKESLQLLLANELVSVGVDVLEELLPCQVSSLHIVVERVKSLLDGVRETFQNFDVSRQFILLCSFLGRSFITLWIVRILFSYS